MHVCSSQNGKESKLVNAIINYRSCAITNDPVIHYPSIAGFINISRLILIYYLVHGLGLNGE